MQACCHLTIVGADRAALTHSTGVHIASHVHAGAYSCALTRPLNSDVRCQWRTPDSAHFSRPQQQARRCAWRRTPKVRHPRAVPLTGVCQAPASRSEDGSICGTVLRPLGFGWWARREFSALARRNTLLTAMTNFPLAFPRRWIGHIPILVITPSVHSSPRAKV